MPEGPKHLWGQLKNGVLTGASVLRGGIARFSKGGLDGVLLGIAVLFAMYLLYSSWEDFVEGSWLIFNGLLQFFTWLSDIWVVRSILGCVSLLIIYSLVYWWVWVRKRRFVVVSGFRAWGDLARSFPDDGLARRLRDELMALLKRMSTPIEEETMNDTNHEPVESRPPAFFGPDVLSLPETHVTLQYEGISLEGINTFVRRLSKREVVITADLMRLPPGLFLVARTTDEGPWEVRVKSPDAEALELGLKRLAVRAMTSVIKRFQPKAANAFVVLQVRLRELQDYDEALRLAEMTLQAVPNTAVARSNLATAHNDIGIEHSQKGEYDKGIEEFRRAIELNPDFQEAQKNLEYVLKAKSSDASPG